MTSSTLVLLSCMLLIGTSVTVAQTDIDVLGSAGSGVCSQTLLQ